MLSNPIELATMVARIANSDMMVEPTLLSNKTQKFAKLGINKNHLNAIGITHGGYLSALIDSGAGTAAHRAAGNAPCVTISLDIKFIGSSKEGDEIIGHTRILKRTKTLVFLFCELSCDKKIITSASGIWKILKK